MQASEAKFPQRDLIKAIREGRLKRGLLSEGGSTIPPLMIQLQRGSLHNGKLEGTADMKSQWLDLIKEAERLPVCALGCHVDSGVFRGSFEDIEAIKLNTQSPVFADDFVVYGYQLFKVKSSGGDAVKLFASVLPAQDLKYLIKIAKVRGCSLIMALSIISYHISHIIYHIIYAILSCPYFI